MQKIARPGRFCFRQRCWASWETKWRGWAAQRCLGRASWRAAGQCPCYASSAPLWDPRRDSAAGNRTLVRNTVQPQITTRSLRPKCTPCLSVVHTCQKKFCHQCHHVGAVVEVAGSTHTRSTASNLKQVANLLCAQTNSASSYPQRDGKWVVATATGWRPSVADWGNGVSASCTVGPIVC